jgi:hypothetical protein
MSKPAVDEATKSDFVREMEAAIAKRLAAVGRGKAAVDREIAGIVRKHLGRDAWQAMVDAERESDDVPRATRRDRSCPRRKATACAGRATSATASTTNARRPATWRTSEWRGLERTSK